MIRNLHLVLAASLMVAGGAVAQQAEQPPRAEEPATAVAECTPAQPPGRLMVTMPTAAKRPACADRGNCSKTVADQFNASIIAHNKSMSRINEATAEYVDALNDYARAAGRYAQCEIDRLNEVVLRD